MPMHEEVHPDTSRKPSSPSRLPSLAGRGLPERMRSTVVAFMGLTAAAGLALVAIFAQMGFPLLSPAPLPDRPVGEGFVAESVPLAQGTPAVGLAQAQDVVAVPDPVDRGDRSGPVERAAGAAGVGDPSRPVSSSAPDEERGARDPVPTPSPTATPDSPPASTTTAATPEPAPAPTPAPAPAPAAPAESKSKPASSKPPKSKPKPASSKPEAKPAKPEPKPAKPEAQPVPPPTSVPAPAPPAPVEKDKDKETGKPDK